MNGRGEEAEDFAFIARIVRSARRRAPRYPERGLHGRHQSLRIGGARRCRRVTGGAGSSRGSSSARFLASSRESRSRPARCDPPTTTARSPRMSLDFTQEPDRARRRGRARRRRRRCRAASAQRQRQRRTARQATRGTYLAGDFHNHTTCSDGSISMQKKVKKSMDRTEATPWGLDWFVQAGHGGTGNRNCTLAEDASLATPAYPLVYARRRHDAAGPADTTWQQHQPGACTPKGNVSGSGADAEHVALAVDPGLPVPAARVPGGLPQRAAVHGRRVGRGRPRAHLDGGDHRPDAGGASTAQTLPTTAGYTPLGNANALAQWQYCFDRGNSDTSRGNTTTSRATSTPASATTGTARCRAARTAPAPTGTPPPPS